MVEDRFRLVQKLHYEKSFIHSVSANLRNIDVIDFLRVSDNIDKSKKNGVFL